MLDDVVSMLLKYSCLNPMCQIGDIIDKSRFFSHLVERVVRTSSKFRTSTICSFFFVFSIFNSYTHS